LAIDLILQNAPLMFFASVRRGREPMNGVHVKAIVERISDDLTDNVTVLLTDDGRGGIGFQIPISYCASNSGRINLLSHFCCSFISSSSFF
jgi:hypothetical protein